MAHLVIETRDGVQRVALDRERLSIGRLSHNDVVLPFAQISRQHAELRRINAQWWIADLHSTNGLHLNDRRIQEHALRSGDSVLLAPGITLLFVDEDPASRAVESQPTNSIASPWRAGPRPPAAKTQPAHLSTPPPPPPRTTLAVCRWRSTLRAAGHGILAAILARLIVAAHRAAHAEHWLAFTHIATRAAGRRAFEGAATAPAKQPARRRSLAERLSRPQRTPGRRWWRRSLSSRRTRRRTGHRGRRASLQAAPRLPDLRPAHRARRDPLPELPSADRP